MEEKKLKRLSWREILSTSFRLIALIWQTNKTLFIFSMLATLIPSVLPFVNAYIYKLIIDLVVGVINGKPFVMNIFLPLLGIRIVTYFAQYIAYLLQDLTSQLLWTKMPIVFNQILFRKIASLDVAYFENSDFRDLLERVRDAYTWRPQNLVSSMLYSLQSLVQVGIALGAIIQLNPYLILLILIVAIPEFINRARQSRIAWAIWNWNSPLQKRFWYLVGMLQDGKSVKEIKLLQLADKFLKDLKEIQEKFFEENAKVVKENFFYNIGLNGLETIVFVGVEVYVIVEALLRRVTVGDISFYTTVVSNFQNGLGGLFRNINDIMDHSLYINNLWEVIDAKSFITNPKHPAQLSAQTAPTIEFQSVDFTYPGTTQKVLKNFSLIIKPGEKVAFVGENGAGKTTIIRLLARLYDVDSGKILINGISVKELSVEQWQRQLGILFQDYAQYEYPLKENIHFGNIQTEAQIEHIISAANQAGADDVAKQLENGYDQMLGRTFEDGVELSVGQWQKVALARAFFRNAPILVLDEPTAAIDAKAEAEIFEKVNHLSKGKTVIIVSHRFSTVRQADTIYVIKKGSIAESGNHEEMMKKKGDYAMLFNLQAKGYR